MGRFQLPGLNGTGMHNGIVRHHSSMQHGASARVVIVDTDEPSVIYTDDDVVQVDEVQYESQYEHK